MFRTQYINLFCILWSLFYFASGNSSRGRESYHAVNIDVKSNQGLINTTVTQRSEHNMRKFRQGTNDTTKLRGGLHGQFTNTSALTEHLQNLTLTVSVAGLKFILELKLNNQLFPAKYTERIVTANGSTIVDIDIINRHCYYTGSVKDHPSSIAAVSTCDGIIGYFQVENEQYYIEPLDKASACLSCLHKVYVGFPDMDLLNKIRCGTDRSHNISSFSSTRKKRATLLDWPQDFDPTTKIVEMYVAIDNAEYVYYNSSYTAVTNRIKILTNIASATYQPLDIYIVLVGVEIWTVHDMMFVNVSNALQTLAAFSVYMQGAITTSHDVAQLLTKNGVFEELNGSGIAGLAYLGAMCSSMADFFIVDFNPFAGIVATATAHELGHSLGLSHDDLYDSVTCACAEPDQHHCVMWSATLHVTSYWSACSKTNLTTNLLPSAGACLHNMPPSVFDASALCGDGLVEAGEQCDCGRAPSIECNVNCCNNVTCQLIGTAQCAFGKCCDVQTCTFKPAFGDCRPNANSCDLSEYCSGTDQLCPSDVYKQDYVSCSVNSISAFCYEGQCRSRESQCVAVWGAGVGVGDESCYDYINTLGVDGGNCGLADPKNYTVFIACSSQDGLCGLLQCNQAATTPVDDNYIDRTTFVRGGGLSSSCKSVLYSPANTGMVPNGASCSTDLSHTCVNQVCTPVTSITPAVTCPNCNFHGICNDIAQCHCDVGYAPPDCSQPGNGGSTHSNGIAQLVVSTTTPTTTTPKTTTPTTTTPTTTTPSTTTPKTTTPTTTTPTTTTPTATTPKTTTPTTTTLTTTTPTTTTPTATTPTTTTETTTTPTTTTPRTTTPTTTTPTTTRPATPAFITSTPKITISTTRTFIRHTPTTTTPPITAMTPPKKKKVPTATLR